MSAVFAGRRLVRASLASCLLPTLLGAGGMATEVLALSCAGLALGFERSAVWGLAFWLAGWATGAYLGGRSSRPRRAMLWAGGLALFLGPLTCWALASLGQAPASFWAAAVGKLLLLLAPLPQGALWPLLAQDGARSRLSAGLFFTSSLGGSVLGAVLLGFEVPARLGLLQACGLASLCSAISAALGAWQGRADTPAQIPPVVRTTIASLSSRRAGWYLACATVWMISLEWIALRLGVLWLGGMQHAQIHILAASLCGLALGAASLAPILPPGRGGLAVLGALGLGATLWPWLAPTLLHQSEAGAFLSKFPAGSHLGDFLRALILAGPMLLPFGAVLPLLHRSIEGASRRRLGDLLRYEVVSALLGLPLLHLWVVPTAGLGGTLAVLTLGGGALLAWSASRPSVRLAAFGCTLLVASLAWRAPSPVLLSPALSNPAFQQRFFGEDECFAVSVVDDALRGERTLLTDDFRATATGPTYRYMYVLGHLPLLLHQAPKRVAVLALGTGTTAGAIALHPQVERIEVLEISRRVCEAIPWFEPASSGSFAQDLASALAGEPGRVRLHLGDGRRTLGGFEHELDVLTMEPLLPDSPFAVHLYTPEFYQRARRALAEDGLLCQWLPPHALSSPAMDTLVRAFASSFPWSGLFQYGTQLILLGAKTRPQLQPARFENLPEPLRLALVELGLTSALELAVRLVLEPQTWPVGERSLRDLDPWIVYRPRPRGLEALLDLPLNLRLLRERAGELPASWSLFFDQAGLARLEAQRQLHLLQEAWARRRVLLLGGTVEWGDSLPSVESLQRILERDLPRDPEVRALLDEIAYEEARLAGFVALARGLGQEATREFLRAYDRAGERADLHLFLALALELQGERTAAERALERALGLCPRIFETPQAQRLADLLPENSMLRPYFAP